MKPNPNGRILYQGPSMLDGAPIVVIATGFAEASANTKTGPMLQTWILRQDIPPHQAFKSPEGVSVCGNCPHFLDKTCYVDWARAPLAVWNCWHHGAGYAPATPADFDDALLRMGSGGDPAAVPPWVWHAILPRTAGRTGYTHQWRGVGAWLRGVVMASCDSLQDLADARAAGWRCFLVTPEGHPDLPGVAHCAASTERGNKTNCATCRLCDGDSADVMIWGHGSRSSRITWHPIPESVTA